MIPTELLTTTDDTGQTVCAAIAERPRDTSDNEWRAAEARSGIVIPDGAQTIAVVVLHNPDPWREPETRVFVGDDPETEDAAEQVAWEWFEATGETSYVEVAWSWPAASEPLAVNCASHSPGFNEIKAGYRFTDANRHMWATNA